MRYVTYVRAESGAISRTHSRIVIPSAERARDYPHQEPLIGWPERSVYWTRETGSALGLAPVYAPKEHRS